MRSTENREQSGKGGRMKTEKKRMPQREKAEGIEKAFPVPEKEETGCPFQDRCGGCEYQGIPYEEQLRRKEEGLKELLSYVNQELKKINREPVIFEREYMPEITDMDLPFEVTRNDEGEFVVEGPAIEKMLGYTNLESEKGFLFFQKFLRERGILQQLTDLGIQEGDTVRMYGLSFDYYPE